MRDAIQRSLELYLFSDFPFLKFNSLNETQWAAIAWFLKI